MPSAAAIPASPHISLIAELSRAADPEPLLEQAMAQLARGGDLPLLLNLAAAMTKCNLAGMARLLLQSAGQAIATQPPVRAMLEQMARVPSGEVALLIVQERFRRNVALVCESRPHLRSVLSEDNPPSGIRFFCSRAGNLHAVRESSDGILRTIFPFIDFRSQVANTRLPEPTLLTATALIGVPSPALLAKLLEQRIHEYQPPIDVVETDIDVLRVWLGLLENAEGLRDQRVGIHVGKGADERYADALIDAPHRASPTIILTNHRPNWSPPKLDAQWRENVEQRAQARRKRLLESSQARLARFDAAHWRKRFAAAASGEHPLRIVGFTNRYSTVVRHAMRDFAAAFIRQGHRFDIVMQPDDCSSNVDVAGTLATNEVDMIVAINHLRFEYPDSIPRGLPYVGWIQDHLDHLWGAEAGASIGEHDLVIAHAPDVLSGLYGYRRDRMLASSNLTDQYAYSADPLPDPELEPHRCDLSFVSHGSGTPDELVADIAQATNAPFGRMMRSFLELAKAELDSGGCLNAQRLLEVMLQAERASGHPAISPHVRRSVVYPQVARIHDRLFRHQTLDWAARWAGSRGKRLRIYGRGWKQHPTLAKFAAGEIASGRGLRAVYQASAINLQANAYASLHQRLLDGLACGAMVISRHNPADHVREPFLHIARAIRERNIRTLEELVAIRRRDRELSAICDQAEALSGVVIQTVDHPRRREQVRDFRDANDIAELQHDAGLFEMLRDLRYIPARAAGDIPGFDTTTFRNEPEMHALLDRLSADPGARQSTARAMRDDLLRHDTFDVLALRVIRAFAHGVGA